MSQWQKTKLKHKTGLRKKQLETHFGIKSKEFEKKFSIEKPVKKSKKEI